MANKTWTEVHNELMKDPEVAKEVHALKGRMERVMLYYNARESKGLSQSAVARGAKVNYYKVVQALENEDIDIKDIDPKAVEDVNNFLGIN
jgi:hypothetical protein